MIQNIILTLNPSYVLATNGSTVYFQTNVPPGNTQGFTITADVHTPPPNTITLGIDDSLYAPGTYQVFAQFNDIAYLTSHVINGYIFYNGTLVVGLSPPVPPSPVPPSPPVSPSPPSPPASPPFVPANPSPTVQVLSCGDSITKQYSGNDVFYIDAVPGQQVVFTANSSTALVLTVTSPSNAFVAQSAGTSVTLTFTADTLGSYKLTIR